MAANQFEKSRISEGTFRPGAQHVSDPGVSPEESRTISRDDVRDGGEPRSKRPARGVLSASTLVGDRVQNTAGENLGSIEEIMIDTATGRIAYAVLSFGGFIGIGNKLFAVPWKALQMHPSEHEFILDIPREKLESAAGFDKDNWPDTADPVFGNEPFWNRNTDYESASIPDAKGYRSKGRK